MSYLYLHLFPHNSTAVCCSRVYPNRKPAVTLSEGEEVLEAVCGRHVTEHFFLETIKVLMMSNQRCISVSAGIQAASRRLQYAYQAKVWPKHQVGHTFTWYRVKTRAQKHLMTKLLTPAICNSLSAPALCVAFMTSVWNKAQCMWT